MVTEEVSEVLGTTTMAYDEHGRKVEEGPRRMEGLTMDRLSHPQTAHRRRACWLALAGAAALGLATWGCFRETVPLAGEDRIQASFARRDHRSEWRSRLEEALLPHLTQHDTQYPLGYREEAFRTLKLGTTEAEIQRLLGPPFSTQSFPGDTACWYYSRPGKHKDYFVRVLEFDREGRLLFRHHTFYLD